MNAEFRVNIFYKSTIHEALFLRFLIKTRSYARIFNILGISYLQIKNLIKALR